MSYQQHSIDALKERLQLIHTRLTNGLAYCLGVKEVNELAASLQSGKGNEGETADCINRIYKSIENEISVLNNSANYHEIDVSIARNVVDRAMHCISLLQDEASHPAAPQQEVGVDIVSDEEINKARQYANFGNTPKRTVILDTLKKVAQGWGTGHTAMCIVKELGLVEVRNGGNGLSDKGLQYLLASSHPSPAQPLGDGEKVYNIREVNEIAWSAIAHNSVASFANRDELQKWLEQTNPAKEQQ